uniref:ABC transporter domain-containing protein n=1 Tax=Scophthalmus maximus TaxID=52904 RepID=A0A8D3BX85_SCOMX
MSKGEQSICGLEEYFQERGPTLTFSNLHYCVQETRFCRKTGPGKYILKDVSGIMRPGMNAIMGATGSGKTSLLDVIAGRKDPAGLRQGSVLVDGKTVTSELRLSSAYVVQDDILMGTLSVRENLLFSANLRLDPKRHSGADKHSRVDAIIQDLGLADCAKTKIGTEFIRGVSGGERKRCSIGMELITSPALLFLDEPTTGLDSNTANCIISLLHKLSRRGKTVIFSIHQPRYSIFKQFDHLTLMHKGEVVYAGAADHALGYFTDLDNQITSLGHRSGAFFFLIINMVFGNLSAVELFINERAIFIHENSSGYYRTSVYFLSKIFADLIPNRIIPIFVFSAIAYYMMGLKPAFEAFLCFALTMSLVSLAGVGLAFLVSASVSSFAMANILIALPFVFMMVFGGFLVNLNSMLSWLSWLKWISIFKYGLDAAFINEMKGQLHSCKTQLPPYHTCTLRELFLKSQGIDYSVWGFWQNQVALLGIVIVSMFLAYVQLRRINRWK